VDYTPDDGDIICSASYRQNHQKSCRVFERAENLLQNGILHCVFGFSQSSEIELES